MADTSTAYLSILLRSRGSKTSTFLGEWLLKECMQGCIKASTMGAAQSFFSTGAIRRGRLEVCRLEGFRTLQPSVHENLRGGDEYSLLSSH